MRSYDPAQIWFNDLLEFDPESMIWSDLSSMISGTLPAPSSYSQGFTSLDGQLFLFGGEGFQGSSPDVSFL